MYETIVYPTDGSETAREAFEHARELAQQYDATLHVVYVLKTNEPAPGIEDPTTRRDPDTGGKAAVEAAAREATESGIETVEAILRGPTARAIAEYVDEHDADLVVMGTHGRTGLDRLVLGSVADEVIRAVRVPVVVCRGPTDG